MLAFGVHHVKRAAAKSWTTVSYRDLKGIVEIGLILPKIIFVIEYLGSVKRANGDHGTGNSSDPVHYRIPACTLKHSIDCNGKYESISDLGFS